VGKPSKRVLCMATEFLGLFEQLIHRWNEELEIVAITARGIYGLEEMM
jgi:hypothetical protein